MENQVGTLRRRVFVPRLSVDDYEQLNRHLEAQCIALAKTLPHPEFKEQTGYFGIIFRNPNYYTKVPEIKVELNERQKIIINYLSINKTVTNRQYCSMCKTDRVTAFRDLKELEKKGIILRKSKGRSLYYVLREANNEANNEANKDKIALRGMN